MTATQSYLQSATDGCAKLSRILECINEETCPECGHGCRLDKDVAKELDHLVWAALRFVEANP